jgi:hypothetical protein
MNQGHGREIHGEADCVQRSEEHCKPQRRQGYLDGIVLLTEGEADDIRGATEDGERAEERAALMASQRYHVTASGYTDKAVPLSGT